MFFLYLTFQIVFSIEEVCSTTVLLRICAQTYILWCICVIDVIILLHYQLLLHFL